ncbi:MAG TPA: thiamine pyrophosphate-dependent enzyme [candidate division Zixibacteria bacterium]|nr:thiamine pyrophosphate-dependent enzyme [candidate division Zixibacteria bacterium]
MMHRVLFNRAIGPNPHSFLLPEPVRDVGDYGAIPTSGLTSGHQGCIGCGMVTGTNQLLRAMKLTGRHVVASIGTGCNEVITTQNTSCWGAVSVDHNNFPNTGATLSGNIAALRALARTGVLREQDFVNVGIAGDGGTYDIGLQAFLAWIARGENGVYVCLNNQAYMNTGVQGSGATPFGATTSTTPFGKAIRGNQRRPQYLLDLAIAAGAAYAASACPLFHRDLMIKAQKAAAIEGPCVLEIYSVCPEGWKSDTDVFHEITELALETRSWVLYEAERQRGDNTVLFTLNYVPKRFLPVSEYLKLQERFAGMSAFPDMVREAQAIIDARWAFWEPVLEANGIRWKESAHAS